MQVPSQQCVTTSFLKHSDRRFPRLSAIPKLPSACPLRRWVDNLWLSVNITSDPFVPLAPGETPLTCVLLLHCLSLISFFSLVISISLLFSAFGDSLGRVLRITDAIIHGVYWAIPDPLQDSANSFFYFKTIILISVWLLFLIFHFPISNLTFDIYCLISSLISCFMESRLNGIILKGQADAAVNYFCFLR